MTTTHVTDHVARAIARLRQQYRDKPNIEAWVTILVEPVQRLEDALWQLLTLRGIDEAIGAQLDVIGKLVGQPRDGRLDDIYRRFIRAKISTNKSRGTASDILTVADLVLDLPDATLVLARSGTGSVVLRIDDEVLTDELASLLVVYFMRKTVAAGVRFILEYSTVPEAEGFYWDTTDWDDGLIWSTAIE